MHSFYATTSLSKKSLAHSSGYIDWATQPSIFKHYPSFLFHYNFGEKEELKFMELARSVTSKEMIGNQPYCKLTTPSAGNLHPIELYMQVRGMKGIISGIYHVDASEEKFRLLQEIDEDGLESLLGLPTYRLDGIVCILSCVPFRSEWKYGKRALRYCYLDAGHQLGSIKAAATIYDQELTILSDFDVAALRETMGFKDEEFVCSVLYFGRKTDKKVKPLQKKLLHVAPTNYSDIDGELFSILKRQSVFKGSITPINAIKERVLRRRSARKFENICLSEQEIQRVQQIVKNISHPLVCHIIFLNEENKERVVELLLGQSFIKNAQMVMVFTSKYFSAQMLMQSGIFVQKLALELANEGLKSSGIGAFYDKKMQEFLDTDAYILYTCALGK